MSLEGKVAIVTGAGSGIGRAIALAMAAQGASVAVVDIDKTAANETLVRIAREATGDASGVALEADTSRAEDISAAVVTAVDELGPLDIMVNNAGILDGYFNVDEMDEAVWNRVLAINLTGVYLGCKRALEEMLPRGRGRIINMASVAGLGGTGGGAAYVASKHGVVGLTRQMAVAYSERGITINAICPGAVPTGLRQHSQRILGPAVPDMSGRGVAVDDTAVRAVTPMGRRGTVEEIAAAACFLASDEASYITGHTLVIDGGWRAK